MKKIIALFLALMMAVSLVACAGNETAVPTPETTVAPETTPVVSDVTPLGEGAASFFFNVTDVDGSETKFQINTDAATVGEALIALGLIAGDESDWGLYVTTVNGITADWDSEQAYWAFYIDGEYAQTGVDTTEVTAGATYSFVKTISEDTASDSNVLGEGATSFTLIVTDVDGTESTFTINTDAATVGDALIALGLIAGDESDWGLYVTTVNGITADWDTEQAYWAFYIDGEYAMTGVDATEVTAGATYSFVKTISAPTATVLGEGDTVFTVITTDLDGVETPYEIHTNETTVGAALLAVELIAGEESDYGLYVTTVNGITLDWDTDGKYWAFYVDGEYAQTGVDTTEVVPGATYTFKAE